MSKKEHTNMRLFSPPKHYAPSQRADWYGKAAITCLILAAILQLVALILWVAS